MGQKRKAKATCRVCEQPTDGWLTIPENYCSYCYRHYLFRLQEKHGMVCLLCEFFTPDKIFGGLGFCAVKQCMRNASAKFCQKGKSKIEAMDREREEFG